MSTSNPVTVVYRKIITGDVFTNAELLDPNGGNLVVHTDNYVYFQAGDKGLYKVPEDMTYTWPFEIS